MNDTDRHCVICKRKVFVDHAWVRWPEVSEQTYWLCRYHQNLINDDELWFEIYLGAVDVCVRKDKLNGVAKARIVP
jgi:hypothetical protein